MSSRPPESVDYRRLPKDRLSTTDDRGRRIYLYPADVQGRYRTRRTITHFVLVLFFLVLPWVRYDGRQAVLVDFMEGRFSFFAIGFWSHDAPLLLFLFGGMALLLAFVTSLWGRIWCGWGCPQTVFTDGVFRRIERWIEGNALDRKKLDEAPWSSEKIFKKCLKWSIFVTASLIIAHSFLAYWIGTDRLRSMMTESPTHHLGTFFTMLILTSAILFDLGWFREQFCTIVCPYGRFQSVLMDDHSMVVAYDSARGEPRRGTPSEGQKVGDCVDCFRCVQVCPTGIDIRRGLQLECIACTACMDACDEVMTRLKKPRGLIRYQGLAQNTGKRLRMTPRSWAYLVAFSVFLLGITLSIRGRQFVDITLTKASGEPYQLGVQKAGVWRVVNHFRAHLHNQSFEPAWVTLEIDPTDRSRGISLVAAQPGWRVEAGKAQTIDVFFEFPKNILELGKSQAKIILKSQIERRKLEQQREQNVSLIGPF